MNQILDPRLHALVERRSELIQEDDTRRVTFEQEVRYLNELILARREQLYPVAYERKPQISRKWRSRCAVSRAPVHEQVED